MKKMINRLFGMLLMLAVAVMPLQVMGSEVVVEPTKEELAEVNEEINAYVASLSDEDQEECYRQVAEIEEEYERQLAASEVSDEGDEVAEQEDLSEEIDDQSNNDGDEADELAESAE